MTIQHFSYDLERTSKRKIFYIIIKKCCLKYAKLQNVKCSFIKIEVLYYYRYKEEKDLRI